MRDGAQKSARKLNLRSHRGVWQTCFMWLEIQRLYRPRRSCRAPVTSKIKVTNASSMSTSHRARFRSDLPSTYGAPFILWGFLSARCRLINTIPSCLIKGARCALYQVLTQENVEKIKLSLTSTCLKTKFANKNCWREIQKWKMISWRVFYLEIRIMLVYRILVRVVWERSYRRVQSGLPPASL